MIGSTRASKQSRGHAITIILYIELVDLVALYETQTIATMVLSLKFEDNAHRKL